MQGVTIHGNTLSATLPSVVTHIKQLWRMVTLFPPPSLPTILSLKFLNFENKWLDRIDGYLCYYPQIKKKLNGSFLYEFLS